MSTHIKAFIPDTDNTFQKHKKVLVACLDANVSLPKETAEYFGANEPDLELLDEKLSIELKEFIHYTPIQTDGETGFEVDLRDIPKGVTKLRFYNSW